MPKLLVATYWLLAVFFGIFSIVPYSKPVNADEIKVGVRAHRGAEIAFKRWQPTADYLNQQIPDHTFTLVPFEINSLLNQAVSRGEFEFVLTNPASHVEQKIRYNVSPIATLINKRKGDGYTQFGSVIFTRSDRHDINTIRDLKGKTFMGADEEGFGGWRVAWFELLANEIDPYKDFKLLSFGGGIQQNVVFSVLNGKVDAGSVRTDMLERMEQRGEINLETFKIIAEKHTPDFGFYHSTRLYPEWPFAKLSHAPDELARRVAAVLYNIPANSEAAKSGKYIGWTVPLDYSPVDMLLKELRVGPYTALGPITWREFVGTYWQQILLIIVVFVASTTTAYVVTLSNRRLKLIHIELESEINERNKAQNELETYQRQLEEMVAERTAALESSNKELESYSYSIAHDLRSPLRSIIGFSQIIEEDASKKLNKDELDSLQRIVDAGKHMAELIDDILELSRISRTQLNRTIVDITALTESIANQLKERDKNRMIDWRIQKNMIVNGDKQLLKIMLQNLIDNAWKFTCHTDNPIIEIGQEETDNSCAYYVRDNGVGFHMKYVDKLFMPFQRLYRDEFEGTGIGLATVQRVIQRHGGDVWAESNPDFGATFYFTLPPSTDTP